ncbi:Fe-S protein assembly co-chaperone HscB [Niveibacterium umoris]|uniref:Co-chaperone protein HscB homolog n=1 Tax=Niveibacterium umoris TaxID=1193620 RepID=A0A840BEI8_9RHOO|nr:Fe-S protein assembly co-chaperone HscB [Niveibacterium umoris]MBB4011545.1 molecular chaperone HscB [Niveibacterium umoris]
MNFSDALGDYFSLFGLPRRYAVDLSSLESAYLDVQAKIHPDRFSHLAENERRVAMQWAAHANEGYRVLRKAVPRARYLLHLAGVDPRIESNTAMPPEFLMRQMMLREAVEEAEQTGDVDALDDLLRELRHDTREMEQSLAADFDQRGDLIAATSRVRQLMFLERLQEEIGSALETLEN